MDLTFADNDEYILMVCVWHVERETSLLRWN